MFKDPLKVAFYILACAFWTLYGIALSAIVLMLASWDPATGAHKLHIAIGGYTILFGLNLFVWWAEYGERMQRGRGLPRTCGLPELNSWHWIYIISVMIWLAYFAPVAYSHYLLLTWTYDTGTWRLGISIVNFALVYLMSTRIGRQ